MFPLVAFKDWLLKNWKVILGIVLVLGAAIWLALNMSDMQSQNAELKTMVQEQQARHVAELTEMSESFQRQQTAQDELDRHFEERLTELSAQYAAALEQVAQVRRVRQRRLEQNPTELPGAFQETFGIPVSPAGGGGSSR